MPVDLARNLTEMLLKEGDDASKVQQLLGTPDVRERSANLAETHEPMRLGTTWRYELPQARFTVTFSPEGKLAAWKWMLPANGRLELNRTAGSDYRFTYDFLTMPIPSTMDVKPTWRNQGNLNYAYLIGGTGDVLLVNGDDGGFSGMHYASSIYAVDRDTGEKLWQADAGFGMFGASLDASRGTAAVYTEYDPGREKYEGRIREFRLRDGKVVWEKSLPKERQIRMHAVKGAILLQQTASNGASEVLSVLDRATGKQRWNRTLTGKRQVLETGAEYPYILLQDGSKLKALDPLSGKEKWSVQGAGAVQQDPQGNPYFGYGNLRQPLRHDASRWFLIGSEWMLLNTENGKVLGKYPWKPQERFEATSDSRYLLVQRSEGTGDFDHSKVKETVFYDAVLRRSLWTLPGKAANGMIDGNRLYVVLDGRPAAVDREKGTLLWQMPVTSRESSSPYAMDEMAKTRFAVLSEHLLLGYGSDVLVLRKEDGGVLGLSCRTSASISPKPATGTESKDLSIKAPGASSISVPPMGDCHDTSRPSWSDNWNGSIPARDLRWDERKALCAARGLSCIQNGKLSCSTSGPGSGEPGIHEEAETAASAVGEDAPRFSGSSSYS